MDKFLDKIFFRSKNLNNISENIKNISENTPAKKIFKAINNYSENSELRFVGGCIRKIINREEVDDIDLATNITPDEVCEALNKHQIKFFESGKEHGTITAVINEANLVEADVIAGYKESGKTCIQVFFYRSKQNWGNQAFFPKHDPDEKLSEILNSFVSQFYENKSVPSAIILSEEIKEKILIEKTLTQKEGKQINISVAKKGSKLKVVNQAIKNARDSLNRKLYESQNNRELFDEVVKKFNLETNINLIEVYDNSHIQGTNSVGALIAYGDEGFIKKRYRKFNIKHKINEQDDYGMMKEVLNRRFKRAVQEKDNYLTFPDLVLVDGGKGQYSVARESLNELGLHDIPIIAIAKGKFRNSGNETFFHNGKEYKFSKNDPTLFFLQRIRDESHRFAISAHRAKRKKGISKSLLDQIEGIGAIRKRALLNHFGSARSVESASLDEIKSVEGVEEKVAKKIYNFFHE